MIIDSHAHFEHRMLDLNSLVAKMDDAGVDKIALIPSMNDPLPNDTGEFTLATIRTLMRRKTTRPLAEAIHRSTLTPEGDLRWKGRTYQIYNRPDNSGVVQAISEHPDRFAGWIFLNPRNNPGVVEEFDHWRGFPGMVGVKLHPHWHDYRTEILSPLLARIQETGMPVLIHLGFRKRGDFKTLCETYPSVNFIFAHAGFPFFKDLWKFGKKVKNVYVDLSSPYINESLARRTVKALGPNRCLYGTDSPYGFHVHGHGYDYKEIMGWIDRMKVSSPEKDRIFGGNFQGLVRDL